MFRPFNKVLVANRGEIACRVMHSAKAKGYATVAVASEADSHARHVRLADEAIILGPAAARESYLNIDRLLAAARRTGADAIHPGYGFLSERGDFAQACIDAGIVFIGPSPDSIRAMGDKAESKRRMIAAGVPCVPGYEGTDQDDERLIAEAARIGYPVMVKASAGGGGRGMRLVEAETDLRNALTSARSEAKSAFGDETLLLERALREPRHIEIQVFGDSRGQIIHLGERDCSVQRRHQKVIEESPSSVVDSELRAKMGAAAVQAARSIDYVGAGTVEFLLDADGKFYFLEMNTRLQVEHAVTEMVTGLDLVALQLDVAAGKALPFGQREVTLRGHAIEARLYAEDAAIGFLPQTGRVALWEPATGDGLRIDHGILEGTQITPFYDPMIAKVIAWGMDREEARRRLVQCLRNTAVLGVTTNKLFLIDVLQEQEFVSGEATTGFIARHFPAQRLQRRRFDPEALALAAVLFAEQRGAGWRSSGWLESRIILRTGEQRASIYLHRSGDAWEVRTDDFARQILVRERTADALSWDCDRQIRRARYVMQGAEVSIDTGADIYVFTDETNAPPASGDAERSGDLRAPMSGLVIALHVAIGDSVKRGQVVAVLEAMKMEHQLIAVTDGVVTDVPIAKGAQVGPKALLVSIRAEIGTA